MPPTMAPLRVCVFRPRRPNVVLRPVIGVKRAACRTYADMNNKTSQLPEAEAGQKGPGMGQQEHVSEEAAKMAKITGGEGPDLDVGTPVQEILADDKDARKQAPQVMKDQIKQDGGSQGAANSKPSTSISGTRSFSTLARRRQELQQHTTSEPPPPPLPLAGILPTTSTSTSLSRLQTSKPATSVSASLDPSEKKDHKFPLPTLPLPPNSRVDHRYDTVVEQCTNLLMKDGKKSVAQRNMATILSILRTTPAPTYSTARPLLPGAPPAQHLPLNPILYLTLAIDSVAPLLRIRSQRGAAGGGVALQIPVPLGLRQRRRQAFTWILDAASKRANRGSGRDMFPQRVAQELIAVVEGRSAIWERRAAVHKLGTTARSNLNFGRGGRR